LHSGIINHFSWFDVYTTSDELHIEIISLTQSSCKTRAGLRGEGHVGALVGMSKDLENFWLPALRQDEKKKKICRKTLSNLHRECLVHCVVLFGKNKTDV